MDPELGTARRTCHFLLFVLLSAVMLVYALAVAVIMLYVLYVATESIVFVVALQSAFLVAAVVFGIQAACSASEPALNAYSFMLLMAVVMQFSLAMVVVVKGDEMLVFIASSAHAAQNQLCADLGFTTGDANAALTANVTVDAGDFESAGSELCACTGGATQCVMTYMQRKYGVRPDQYVFMQLVVIVMQLVLAKLAWGMISDLDYAHEQKQQVQAGGPPKGKLRGTIISGCDLLDTRSKSGRDPMCVLELLTPDTAVKNHRVQKAQTEAQLDTLTPQWDQDFEQLVAYECSRQLRISVLDMSKPKKPVPMGNALLTLDGDCILRGTAFDPMDGETTIQVELTSTERLKKVFRAATEQEVPAGTVSLRLLYIPIGGSAERVAKSVAKSWYFEATVLMMVGLSMVILALQSPTEPPSDSLRGTLSLLEIFVATHMTIELALELFAAFANGSLKTDIRNPWMLLALYVCLCNWLAIFQPVEIVKHIGGQGWSKLFSVSRIFRVIRPIRTLRMIRHIDIVMRVIANEAGTLLTVCVLLLFLLLLFSLIGMSCFSGAIHYTCMDAAFVRGVLSGGEDTVVSTDWPQGCTDDCELYLPQTLIARGILRGVQPLQSDGTLVSCPNSLQCSHGAPLFPAGDTSIVRCVQLGIGECFSQGFDNYNASSSEMQACESLSIAPAVGNDEFGYQGFDNLFRAVVTMFVQMTGDGGMHSMPQALHSAGSGSEAIVWAIFFAASVCLNLVALNLFLAVCCGAYSGVSNELDELDQIRAEKQKEREKGMQLDETPEEKQQREAEEADRALSLQDRVDALNWDDTESRVPGCRNFCKEVVGSQTFDIVVSVAILLNTLAMAMNNHGIDRDMARILATVESAFLAFFVLEAILKIFGLGWKLYFMHTSNKFDFFVIFICLAGYLAMIFEDELVAAFGLDSADNGAGMQALRAVRLLRALQLTRLLGKQKAFRDVLRTIFSAWKPICVHAVFCAFSVCMFAVIGMHVFGGSLGCRISIEDSPGGVCPEEERVPLHKCPDCRKALPADYPYEHYETFLDGSLASFELTVGEEWSYVMYWYMAHAGESSAFNMVAIQMFFVVQYLWMNCILFSLFTAMLLQNFNIKEEDKMPIQKRLWQRKKRKELKIWRAENLSLLAKTLDSDKQKGVTKHGETVREHLTHAAAVADLQDNENKSLYIFTLTSPFRLGCATVQGHRYFTNAVLSLIVLSCVSLAVEGPKDGAVRQEYGIFFEVLNAFVLFAFVLEASLKIVVNGFFFDSGPTKPYMRSKKNLLDFFIIVICVVAYLPILGEVLQGGWARSLRLIRVMTPLISLTKNPEILLVVVSFLRALPDTMVVVLPLFLMGLVFGIIGQQWFGGLLGQCVSLDSDFAGLATLESCDEAGATWQSPMFNFDTSLSAVSLLVIAITDGAHGFMVDSSEAVPGGAPIAFWVVFHVVFTCFFLNLFIGVLSASFSKSKGTATRTARQTQWLAVAHGIESFNPVVTMAEGSRPAIGTTCCKRTQPLWWFKFRLRCFNAATSHKVENCWRLAIVVNTLTLASDKFPASAVQSEIIEYINIVCLSLLTVEVLVKLTGYGFRTFFGSGWLVSDFLLVTLSWGLRLGSVRSGVETLRVVRIFRLVALASKVPTLVAVIGSLVACVRTSLALLAICAVIIYFYCIVGMNLFGSLDIDPQLPYYNGYNNFSNFLSAAALLVQIVFGQEIGGFVEDLTVMGVDFWLAFGYFASYYMLVIWVCVNLLLVTIVDTFDAETADTDTDGARLEDFQSFTQCWASLTVGKYMVPYCHKKESFLSRMAHKVAHPVDSVMHAIAPDEGLDEDDLAPEDGASNMHGNLTITVEHVTGVSSDLMRPYCRVQLRGLDKQECWTPETETVSGKAIFQDTPSLLSSDTKAKGCTVSMEINQHHDTLMLAVHDNYQYMGDVLGAIKLSRSELQTMEKSTTKQLQLLRRADVDPVSRDGATKQDHWARFETDENYLHEIVDEFEQLEEGDEFNDSEPGMITSSQRSLKMQSAVLGAHAFKATNDEASAKTADDEPDGSPEASENEPMTKEERKAFKKAEKERKKAEEKRKKRKEKKRKEKMKAKREEEKRAKKEAKRRKKLGLPLEEEEEDRHPPSDDVIVREWIDAGMTLQVTFKFERHELSTPRMGFLADFGVSYAHKESNCGVEGWLECSEDDGPFKRRFVYLQDKGTGDTPGHGGCIEMITNADNGNSLEHLASANRLEILKLPADNIMNIYSEHVYRAGDDPHRKQAKNESQMGCEFQIGVDLQNENTYAEKCVGHISGKIIGAEKLMNVATGKGETSDPYCVLTLISTGMLAETAGQGRQVRKTQTVSDNLNPTWESEFVMDATVTTTTMLVEVYHDRLGRDPLIGTAEFQIASDAGPGSVWSSSSIVSHGGASTVDFAATGRTQVKVRLAPDQRRFKKNKVAPDTVPAGGGDTIEFANDTDRDSDETPDAGAAPDADGTPDADGAGIVIMELLYAPTSSQRDTQYLAKLAQDIDRQYSTPAGKSKKDDAAKLAELRASQLSVIAPKRVDYRFRALSAGNQIAWVTAIRWLTRGCPEATRPKPIFHAALVPAELTRAANNIALIDLPMVRLTRLILGLYKRKAVGAHRPSRRWLVYAIFNMELHAIASTRAAMKNKDTRRGSGNGVYLADLRGLSFHRTLERLALLHLGKKRCLSYERHAAEYELELNSVSLHIIKAVLQWWVNRKRLGKSQGGEKFPKLSIWSTNDALYLRASEGACVARIRSLRVLFGEVAHFKPRDYGVGRGDQSPRVKRAREKRGKKGGGLEQDGTQDDDGAAQVDKARIEAVFKDLDSSNSGQLTEPQIRAGVQTLLGPVPDDLESKMVEIIDTDQSGVADLPKFIQGVALISQQDISDGLGLYGDADSDSDLDELDMGVAALQQKYGADD